MTDDLRTRIAAALSDALVADNSILTVQYGSGSKSNIVVNCNALADAVIRELGPELNRHNTGCVCDDCWGDEHA